ncbi:MAG TPA: histidine--tRNA ligase [Bacteroidia bacterium]|nr:histidine--tRNA ligase [Bacteroidia bacterium]HNU32881.1 histidine--tRNA ligase [Bacteroidia bacterium]
MATPKPSIPKGTRDFSPTEMARRNFILDTIKTIYQRYGFQQIETPAMENIESLTGKYGDEGDQLLFKILNSRIYESKNKEKLKNEFSKALEANSNSPELTERALRYDLTVPFARYVVMHQNEITFPFKRFQMQPVWRADRPQKGRYREFVQCDADVIGSTSLLNEVELVQIIQDVFEKLNVGVAIKINNRKILSGIAEVIGEADKIIDLTVAIDKLDKIGIEKVNEELKAKGLSVAAIEKIQPLFSVKGSNEEKLSLLKTFLSSNDIGKKGIEEVEYIYNCLTDCQLPTALCQLDLTLARGLNYYTGAIFEVKVNDLRSTFTSSVLGGGRYDDLTGIFGLPNVSGVGISFGIDRIYDVMDEMKLFDTLNVQSSSTKVLFVNFGGDEEKHCLKLLRDIRNAGINAEIFPDASAKMKKQMGYADANKIPFVVLVGSEEMQSGKLTLKNMLDGNQTKVAFQELLSLIT